MIRPPFSHTPIRTSAVAVTIGLLALSGCGEEPPAPEPEETPHGYVEGAEETDSPQVRLLAVDADSGNASLFDPETEDAVELDLPGGPVDGVATDGRYGYVSGGDEAAVVDTGVWTVDHGDHNHYYRAESGFLGAVPVEGDARVVGDIVSTVLSSSDGIQVLDRDALDDGEVSTATAPDADALLPLGDLLLGAGGSEDGDTVRVFERDGAPTNDEFTATCAEPGGSAITRRGAVLSCADTTLIVDEDDDAVTITAVENPDAFDDDAAPRLHHRDNSSVLATLDADASPWILDVAEEEWRPLDSDPVVSVLATGEETPVLTLTDDGHLSAYDPHSGEEVASTDLIEPPADGAPAPSLTADSQRAYVADPETHQIHEVDYVDDLRVARTFDLDVRPDHLVQTGW